MFIDKTPTNHPPLSNYLGKISILMAQYPFIIAIYASKLVIFGNVETTEHALNELISLAYLKLFDIKSDSVSGLWNKLD